MDKKAYLLTFGCQMNEYDSEVLETILAANNFLITDKAEEADLAVINTCSVRQKAETRAIARISQITALKKSNPALIVVAAGCMAKRTGESLLEQIPGIDFVVGPDWIPDIPELVQNSGGRKVFVDEKIEFGGGFSRYKPGRVSAYIAISRGCENYCSYCIVPYVRGSFRSRPPSGIKNEMHHLINLGVKDITLLGQNVNSYAYDSLDFPGLLHELAGELPARLRFLTSHPKDLSDRLIKCFTDIPNLCESIHLPLQSGSDKILDAMNRGYDSARYLDLIEKLRSSVPEITLSTDMIVGFPGESEADFQKTIELVEKIRFDSAFMFRYSVRPGTKAAEYNDDVPENVKIDRLNRLISAQQKISGVRNRRWLGRSVEVLIEGVSRRKPIMPKGKARGGQTVLIADKDDLKPGDLITVRIISTRAKTLLANFEKFA